MSATSKKQNKKQTTEQEAAPQQSIFVLGIGLIVIGILLFVSLAAFAWTGGADRSIFDLSLAELFTNTEVEVKNPLGKLGAWVADMLITNGIGIMSLALPWMIVLSGLRILGVRKINLKHQLAVCLGVAIWGSVMLGFVFMRFSEHSYLLAGGAHGHFVATWLVSSIGGVGTFALLTVTLFCFIASKTDRLRQLVVNMLQKLHIKLPNIDMSTYEGETIEMEHVDGDEKRSGAQNGEESANNGDDNEDEWDNDSQNDEENGENEKENGTDGERNGEVENGESETHGMPPMQIVFAKGDGTADREGANGNEYDPQAPINITFAAKDGSRNGNEAEVGQDGEGDNGTEGPEWVVQQSGTEEHGKLTHIGLDEKYDPTLDLANYKFPSIDLLNDMDTNIDKEQYEADLQQNRDKIVETLENFQIKIDRITAQVGPTVTLFEIVPAPGIRISKIQNLENDIALSLSALGIRIVAPMPGRGTIGIEVPNSTPSVVSMKSCLTSVNYINSKAEIPIAIGKDISNNTFVFDLAKTPHLLVAGATGQGKSVGLNAIITSILYRMHPSQVKFVLIDPKRVELSIYKVLEKHYLAKMASEDDAVIVDMDKVKSTLQSLTIEMEDRYSLLEASHERNIKDYNQKFISRQLNPENGHRFMPYIVVVIDEFADLIMQAGKEVEMPIARLAQKARAVGIHIILATQRPAANILTGNIKANFPSRIAFKVSGMVDSRCILDYSGAQRLIGRGDMLVHISGQMTATRVQCAFVDTPEVEKITKFISKQQGYACAYELPDCTVDEKGQVVEMDTDMAPGKFDKMIRQVAEMVVESQYGSTSVIQRQFGVGYNRAGKMMDQLERMGIVSAQEGSKPRQIYITTKAELEKILQSFDIE